MPALKNVPIGATERAWVEVDLGALRRNSRVISERVGRECRLLPMVKADAYGVGMGRVVHALAPLNPWGFGVAAPAEGRALRRLGWTGRVVVFSPLLPEDAEGLAQERLQPVVAGLEALLSLSALDERIELSVHLEIDTGMGRFGLRWDAWGEWAPVVARIVQAGRVRIAGTLTHLHSADSDRSATEVQRERFATAVAGLRKAGVDPGRVHAANSAGAMLYPVREDLVRPGIYLYGGGGWEPAPEPVVAVRARILAVRDMPAGATVSYGATWTADGPCRLATLGIGYGDGLRRELSNRGRSIIRGVAAPIRGVVCMDTTVVDVTGRDDVRAGDVATVLGADGAERIDLREMASLCGTIDYEILTGWTARLPRLELDRDEDDTDLPSADSARRVECNGL